MDTVIYGTAPVKGAYCKVLVLLADFCDRNGYTTYTQWLIWWNGAGWGAEMAEQLIFEINGKIWFDEKGWQSYLIDMLWMELNYTRKSAKEFVRATYDQSLMAKFEPEFLKGKRKKNKYGL